MSRARRKPVVVLAASILGIAGCGGGTAVRPPTPQATTPASGTTGCGKTPPAGLSSADVEAGGAEQHLTSGGTARSYLLAIPPKTDNRTPEPLIVDAHGSGADATVQARTTEMAARATARGFVVVTPDAIDGQWRLADFATDPTAPDAQFAIAMLDAVESRLCVDTTRIYIDGYSLGAAYATALACGFPDRFAAVGLDAEEVPFPCADRLPVVAFHGTADPIVPYTTGGFGPHSTSPNAALPGAGDNLAAWAGLDGCGPAPVRTQTAAAVTHSVWNHCAPGGALEFYSIAGGGHQWPGSPVQPPILGPEEPAPEATDIIIDFFVHHPNQRQPTTAPTP